MARVIDLIGPWTEVKLDIIKKYAAAYSSILSSQKQSWAHHMYVDAFAGPGVNISRTTNEYVPGSPLNALLTCPPFKEYHLIDINGGKLALLNSKIADILSAWEKDPPLVKVYQGDCNQIFMEQVLPIIESSRKRRALCIFDPYGLHLNWELIEAAGQSKKVDMFLNFPTMDAQRNALTKDPSKADEIQRERLTSFCGGDWWLESGYETERTLFGDRKVKRKGHPVVEEFGRQLKDEAGFEFVAKPIPLCNSTGGILFHLFFASQKKVPIRILNDIRKKYT